MSHVDPELLALTALGEHVATPEDDRHIAGCAICAEELTDLRRAALVGRSTLAAGPLLAPPDRVWTAISEELGLASADTAPSRARRRRRPTTRRGPRTLWALAAGVALVAAIGAGVWTAVRVGAPAPVAEALLEPFPDHPEARGTAVLEESADGERTVRVRLDAATAADSYREVWLITLDASSLISLGVLSDDEQSFVVPSGINTSDYALVDVSVEPLDGDPAHSGDSIVRGELRSE
jgi:hypothetical protein